MSEPTGRVLVIGATGSIGRLVVQRLLAIGDRPRALTRDVERARRILGAGADIVAGDLTDPASLATALDDVAAIVLTALAGPPDPGGADEFDRRHWQRRCLAGAARLEAPR